MAEISGNRKEPEVCFSASKTLIPFKLYNQEGLGCTVFSNYPASPHAPSYRLWLSDCSSIPLLSPLELDNPCSFCHPSGTTIVLPPDLKIWTALTDFQDHRIQYNCHKGIIGLWIERHLEVIQINLPFNPKSLSLPPNSLCSSHILPAMRRLSYYIKSHHHITDHTRILCTVIKGKLFPKT